MKKSWLRIFFIIFISLISISVYAQEDLQFPVEETVDETEQSEISSTSEQQDILDEASEEYSEEIFDVDAGTTPGQFGYFVDEFFDRFGNDADVMAEKFAEIKQLLNEGNKEEAKVALENFRDYAHNLQQEASPENRNKVRKYMASINHELSSLRGRGNDDLILEVEDSAKDTLNALELSKVIKEACHKLIELASSDVEAQLQFEQLCKPSDDSSDWHKEYYKELTTEQQAEVKRFVREIKSCFKNPESCDCSAATDNQDFINNCELITKAEVQCRNGDKPSCDVSEELGDEIFQSLEDQPYLREALEDIEQEFSDIEDDRFDNHLPDECRDAGATDRQSCMKVMFSLNAPEECVSALENGELDLTNERNAREQCEKIMFIENAPSECIDAGISEFKECGKFMFKESAPQECLEAGLTGESSRDGRKCEEIMRKSGGENRGRGPGINFDCRKIEDSEKRLNCFDKMASQAQENFDNRGEEGRWPDQCEKAGATDRDSCEKIMRERGQKQRDNREFEDDREFREGFDNRERGSNKFRQGPPCNTPEECEKFRRENPNFDRNQGFREREFPDGEFRDDSREFPRTQFSQDESDRQEFSSSDVQEQQSPESSPSSESSSSETTPAGITGNIIRGNSFLRYYFR